MFGKVAFCDWRAVIACGPFPIPSFHVEFELLWHITSDGHWFLRRSRSPAIQHFRTPRRQLGLSLPRRLLSFLAKIPSLLSAVLVEWDAGLFGDAGVVGEEDFDAVAREGCTGVGSVLLDAVGAGLVDVGVAGEASFAAGGAGVGLVGELGRNSWRVFEGMYVFCTWTG